MILLFLACKLVTLNIDISVVASTVGFSTYDEKLFVCLKGCFTLYIVILNFVVLLLHINVELISTARELQTKLCIVFPKFKNRQCKLNRYEIVHKLI